VRVWVLAELGACATVLHEIAVKLAAVMAQGLPPILTVLSVKTVLNPVPVMVTRVLPCVEPEAGEMLLMTSGIWSNIGLHTPLELLAQLVESTLLPNFTLVTKGY